MTAPELLALEQRAANAVDGPWAADALTRLVRTPSITGDEGAASQPRIIIP